MMCRMSLILPKVCDFVSLSDIQTGSEAAEDLTKAELTKRLKVKLYSLSYSITSESVSLFKGTS